MLGVLLYVSPSLVRWNTYMVGRLVYAGGILVLGEIRHYDLYISRPLPMAPATTPNDRRNRGARLLSLYFLVRSI